MKFTTINYVWQASLLISPVKLNQKLTAAITEKKTNSVFFSRSLFSQKYSTENFSRGHSFHSASVLIDFCLRKLVSSRVFFL